MSDDTLVISAEQTATAQRGVSRYRKVEKSLLENFSTGMCAGFNFVLEIEIILATVDITVSLIFRQFGFFYHSPFHNS